MNKILKVSPSPHIHRVRTASRCMFHVLIALLPTILFSIFYFGLPALELIIITVAASIATEWIITRYMLHRPSTIADGSAALTGVLLALNLPPSLPWWMAVIGAVFSIAICKMAFGGLGCNIFNPAIAGRVFLLISFPAAMTTWVLPGSDFEADTTTGATILAKLKSGALGAVNYEDIFLGDMGGSIGEVAAVALLIGLAYLLIMRVISWHIPVSIIATVCIFEALIGGDILVHLLAGGLLLGAIFMATDYVTSPMTHSGMIVYGVFIGLITVVIREWGSYPEGMSFAILIMNGFTPLIDRYLRPVRFASTRKLKI